MDWLEYGWDGVYLFVILSASEGFRTLCEIPRWHSEYWYGPVLLLLSNELLEHVVGINACVASFTQELTPPSFIYSTKLEERIFQSTSPNVTHLRASS